MSSVSKGSEGDLEEAGTSSMMETTMMEGEEYYHPEETTAWTSNVASDQLCRVCANPNEYLIPIYDGEGVEHQLGMKIDKHLPIQVSTDDKLPLQVCYQCASTIIAWHDLVVGCVEAEKKLRQIYDQDLALEDDDDDDDDKGATDFYDDPMDNEPTEDPIQPSTSSATVTSATKTRSSPKKIARKPAIVLQKSPKDKQTRKSASVTKPKEELTQYATERSVEHSYSVPATKKSLCLSLQDASNDYLLFSDGDSNVDLGICSEAQSLTTSVDSMQKTMDRPTLPPILPTKHVITHTGNLIKVHNQNSTVEDASNDYLLFSYGDSNVDLGICSKAQSLTTSVDSMQKTMDRPTLPPILPTKHVITHTGNLPKVHNQNSTVDNGTNISNMTRIPKRMPLLHQEDLQSEIPVIVSVESSINFQSDSCPSNIQSKKPKKMTKQTNVSIGSLDEITKQANAPRDMLAINPFDNVDQHCEYVCFFCQVSYPNIDRMDGHMKKCHGVLTKNVPLTPNLVVLTGTGDKSEMLYTEPLQKADNISISDCAMLEDHSFPNTVATEQEVKTSRRRYIFKQPKKSRKRAAKFLCITCGRSFVFKHFLLAHVRKAHPKEPSKCSHCNRVFHNAIMLQAHMIQHTGVYPYQCSVCNCNKGFLFETSLAKHLQDQHQINPFKCDICKHNLKSISKLNKHKETVHFAVRVPKPIPEELCFLCGKHFKHLNDHIKRKHTAKEERDIFLCDQCPQTFVCGGTLRYHKMRHTGVKNFTCPTCSKAFFLKRSLVSHLEQHSGAPRPRIHHCTCGKSFVSKYGLDRHKRTFHRDPRLDETCRCTICNETFSTRALLHVHKFHIHKQGKPDKERTHHCVECSRSFSTKSGLGVHIRNSHPETLPDTSSLPTKPKRVLQSRRDENNLYPCKHCDKVYKKYVVLWQHEKNVHFRDLDKTYPCLICNKTFGLNGQLNQHMKTHLEIKPHACLICNKTFSFNNLLVQHMKTHSGDKPFACTYCSKAFTRKNFLTIHTRVHTGEKPYSCDKCGRSFAQQGDMKKHRLKMHN